LDKALQNRPSKLAPNRWDSVLSGAREVRATIAEVKALRQQITETVGGISTASGRMRTKLSELEQGFSELAKEAQADGDGTAGLAAMPPTLLNMTQREVSIYRNGADLCSATAQYFAEALANYKDSLAVLDRCGPMVDRFERAADGFIELASLGKEVEDAYATLAGFAEGLNAILDLFERLAATTREAVAKGTLPIDRASSVAMMPVKPVSDGQVQRSTPARTTTLSAGTKASAVATIGTKPNETKSVVRSTPTLTDLQRQYPDPNRLYWAKKRAGIP
jgi:uncharacterized phage infection (PIP) family protein YhgE